MAGRAKRILLRPGGRSEQKPRPAAADAGAVAIRPRPGQNPPMLRPGDNVKVNLAGMTVGNVVFHAAVTDALGKVVRQVSENPPRYLVELLFSFKGVNEVEVPAERIRTG
jgi:hypothetical protein